MIIVKIL